MNPSSHSSSQTHFTQSSTDGSSSSLSDSLSEIALSLSCSVNSNSLETLEGGLISYNKKRIISFIKIFNESKLFISNEENSQFSKQKKTT